MAAEEQNDNRDVKSLQWGYKMERKTQNNQKESEKRQNRNKILNNSPDLNFSYLWRRKNISHFCLPPTPSIRIIIKSSLLEWSLNITAFTRLALPPWVSKLRSWSSRTFLGDQFSEVLIVQGYSCLTWSTVITASHLLLLEEGTSGCSLIKALPGWMDHRVEFGKDFMLDTLYLGLGPVLACDYANVLTTRPHTTQFTWPMIYLAAILV